MPTRRTILKASLLAGASMLTGTGVARNKPSSLRYWDDHAGFAYAGPQDVDLLDHWRDAGVNYLSINVGYDAVP